MIRVTIDVINPRPDSIYSCLKGKLGREPSHDELTAECKRILAEGAADARAKRRDARRNER
jgi:hypothetical protein